MMKAGLFTIVATIGTMTFAQHVFSTNSDAKNRLVRRGWRSNYKSSVTAWFMTATRKQMRTSEGAWALLPNIIWRPVVDTKRFSDASDVFENETNREYGAAAAEVAACNSEIRYDTRNLMRASPVALALLPYFSRCRVLEVNDADFDEFLQLGNLPIATATFPTTARFESQVSALILLATANGLYITNLVQGIFMVVGQRPGDSTARDEKRQAPCLPLLMCCRAQRTLPPF